MRQEITDGSSYVEGRNSEFWLAGTRVSLDSVVYAFWNGQTAESIAQSFPTLSLEQVLGLPLAMCRSRTAGCRS
jgi:Protein of unknown function (DUF433)